MIITHPGAKHKLCNNGPPMAALRFYWLVFAAGGVLMALEILSSRVLSPHFGNSVYVWGSIISTFLAALSLGYGIGGRLADRHPHLAILGRVLVAVAFFEALLLVAGERMVGFLGEATGGSPGGTLLATAVLFGPATVLLGMVSPWAIRIAGRDLGHLGATAGRLYAVSTVGSLAGTLAATFLLIPYLQLHQILASLLILTVLTGVLALGEAWASAGAWRRELPALILATLLVVLAAGHLRPVTSFTDVLYRRLTPYQTLEVVEQGGHRLLFSDNTAQAGIRLADGKPALPYFQVVPMALVLKEEIRTAVLLGMGGGNAGQMLHQVAPGIRVDYVDIDPAIPDVARRFLHFQAGPGDRIHIRDARRFLAETDEHWDFIYVDTYIGRSVPFHLTTTEFFRLAKERLNPGGVLAVNLASGLGHPFPLAICRTLSDHFQPLYAFQVPGAANVEVFAVRDGDAISPAELLGRARRLDERFALELPAVEILARYRLELDVELQDAPLLTDAYAPVERLVAVSGGEMPQPPATTLPPSPPPTPVPTP